MFEAKGVRGPHALDLPAGAHHDVQSIEVLRVWLANGDQHFSLRADAWEDPAAWGLMLADLARHVAKAYEQSEGRPFVQTLDRVRAGFEVEMNNPTDGFPSK